MRHWSASALSAMLTAFLILCSFGVPASAHKYIEAHKGATRQDPIEIPNHRISHAAYGVLTEEGQTDYFRFTAKKGDSIVAEMLIPDIPRMKEFTPAISLYEPGSSSPSVTQLWIGGEPERFYEPFTQTQYLRRQRLRTVASADGEYLISVHSPNGQTGKYVLTIGDEDRFGLKDVLTFPYVWWKVRMFAEKEASTATIAFAALLLVAYLVFRVARRIA
ncbi:MAG: hypothetical protein WBJ60_06365 [Bacillota bacterium]